jgi:hypothetical protein
MIVAGLGNRYAGCELVRGRAAVAGATAHAIGGLPKLARPHIRSFSDEPKLALAQNPHSSDGPGSGDSTRKKSL